MSDNSDKQRAIKAEKQVERLERELDLVKSRLKKQVATGSGSSSPVLIKESDKINFQLQEQVKDLRHQLKHQQAENTKLQETLTSKTNEYETKLKRMREIFGQASKNIDNYRATITSKEDEIKKLSADLDECQISEQKFKSISESQQLTIEKLNTEVTSSKTFYGSKTSQLETINKQLETKYEQIKSDYEQYKKRANVLLQKNKENKSGNARINELQELIEQLQSQKLQYESEQKEKLNQQSLLEHDLRKALDHINQLESVQNKLTKEKHLNEKAIADLKNSFSVEKAQLESKLSEKSLSLSQTSLQLNELQLKYDQQLELAQKDDELDDITQQLIQFKVKVHDLEELNESLTQEIEKLTVSSPKSSPPSDENLDTLSASPSTNDVYSSMSSLLSPLISRQVPDERNGLQKQVEKLNEMLQESEEKITALQNQEKILKDELRKIDAVEKRQDMNVEYLKNVLIKFLMSENKQAMVPILAKLLYLDDAETNKLRESCV